MTIPLLYYFKVRVNYHDPNSLNWFQFNITNIRGAYKPQLMLAVYIFRGNKKRCLCSLWAIILEGDTALGIFQQTHIIKHIYHNCGKLHHRISGDGKSGRTHALWECQKASPVIKWQHEELHTCSVMSDTLHPMDCIPPGYSNPLNFPSKGTG